MRRLEVSGVVRPIYGSLGVKGLNRLLKRRIFFTHAVFSARRRPQNGFLGVHPSGGREDGIRRVLNLCLNFFNFCTYRSERMVAHLSKNSTKKIPSPSQKTLAMTLHAKIFLTSRRLMMPFYFLPFPRWVIMTNTGFNTGNYYFQKSKSVSLTAHE